MSQKYLLPCRCGQSVVIEPRQAGETVVCCCGTSLPIPTMLGITALEPADAEPPTDTADGPAWGAQQKLVMVGSILATVAAIIAIILWSFGRPIAAADVMDPARLLLVTQTFQPAQTWFYWNQAKQGLDRRADQQYTAALLQFHIWESIAGIVFLIGAALIVSGVMAGHKKHRLFNDMETAS